MPAPRIPRDVFKPKPKVREGDSADYLAKVRQLPCLLCKEIRRGGINAHHVKLYGEPDHGMGLKPEDKRAAPLCEEFHHVPGVHAHGCDEEYFMQHFIQIREYLKALWTEREDLDGMERVTHNFRQEAQNKRARAERDAGREA